MSIMSFLLAVGVLSVAQVSRPTITSINPDRQVAGGNFEVIIEVPPEYENELRLRFYRAERRKPNRIQHEENVRDGMAGDLEDTPGLIRRLVKTDDKWLQPPPQHQEDQTFLVVLLELASQPSGEPVTNLEESTRVSVGPPVFVVDGAKLLNHEIEWLSWRVEAVQRIEEDETRQAQLGNEVAMLKASEYDEAVITFDGLVIHKEVVAGASQGELVTKTLSAELNAAKMEAERTEEAVMALGDSEQRKGLLGRLKGIMGEIAKRVRR